MQGLPTIYVLMSFITVGHGHPLTWAPEELSPNFGDGRVRRQRLELSI
jgi:hypothetical protein